ncbi:MAG: hypothetical protein JO104_00860 [Candidatus Eremiobacteraeota bacterium]|nr:hypothetical protein [Candidatus Eremiobacteraeota bacterium]
MANLRDYTVAATLLALCGCGSGATYAPPSQLDLQAQAARNAPRFRAKRATIYVASLLPSSGYIAGYSLEGDHGMTYYTTSGLVEPEGMTSDSTGAIYVANTYGYNILKFKPPATDPVQEISDEGFHATDVGVDSKGDIWVANLTSRSFGAGNLQEYSAGGKLLRTVTCSNLRSYAFLAIGKKDDVIVDGDSGGQSQPNSAGEVKAGATKCKPLSAIQIGSPGGVQFTNTGDVTVLDQLYSNVYTYAKPAFSKLIDTTHLSGGSSPTEDVLMPGNQYLWTSMGGVNGVFEFEYPYGGDPIGSIGNIYFPTGVAITTRK